MAHRPEVNAKKISDIGTSNPDAYSIEKFCQQHSISVQLFYKNRSQMPRTFNVGTRVLISKEAAAVWRREREQASAVNRAAGRIPTST